MNLHDSTAAASRFHFHAGDTVTHAKFMIVERGTARVSSIIFGGVNVGDRFSRWLPSLRYRLKVARRREVDARGSRWRKRTVE